MRDAERIAPMLELLGAVWQEHPDWRLGQLVCNVAVAADPPAPQAAKALGAVAGMLAIDPFSVEDETMIAGLLAMTTVRHRIGMELAHRLGIDPAKLPKTSTFPRPGFLGDEIDETGEGS